MPAQTWDDFLASIGRLGGVVDLDEAAAGAIKDLAERLRMLPKISRDSLSRFIEQDPGSVPLLALTVRLSQELLKNLLRHHLGTSSWAKLARDRPADVVAMLDDEFHLVTRIEQDRKRTWAYEDVLAERYASRLKAGGAIRRGRDLENTVESIVSGLGLAHSMRTRFVGRGGETAPCDLAIPEGGEKAEIVVGIKGFDSSGSKLTDATREIQSMATVRRPTQYVFVVVDGIGWRSRQADLHRIHSLWADGSIDGVYTTLGLADFRTALRDAARRRGLA